MKFTITNQYDRRSVASYIEKLTEGKRYEVTVSTVRKSRTVPQNKLYWLWLNCISAETGNDKGDLHFYFSEKYLPPHEFSIGSVKIVRPISTTELDTAQFTHYLEKVQQFVSTEMGIILPVPGDLIFEQFREYYEKYI